MARNRNVKILATLGPATSTFETIKGLYDAGADVFRLNMSHGTQDDIAKRHSIIRQVESSVGRPIGILADLQGPKLRIGVFADEAGVDLVEGATFTLDLDETPGTVDRVHLPHPEIFAALEPGATLLVNDGKLRLKTIEAGAERAVCEVMVGGRISNRKGVNVPDVVLPLAALTEKDKSDLEFAAELGVDWMALSFVQRAADVEEARALVKGRAKVMAKIEKPAAMQELHGIISASDGVMVARGDLGVELPMSQVPPAQKRIVAEARRVGKPVVVATQMLESMIEAPVPTRAEVSDVANAIFEGADAVMLSAESAVGAYPEAAVRMMDDIAQTIEAEDSYRVNLEASRTPPLATVADAITAAAREVAETAQTKAIFCFSHSGATAMRAARERPRVPIVAMTPVVDTARQLTLVWGLHCVISGAVSRFRDSVQQAMSAARREGIADGDDKIILTAGVPFGQSGSTNILRVVQMDESRS